MAYCRRPLGGAGKGVHKKFLADVGEDPTISYWMLRLLSAVSDKGIC